jgi:hypothetical protein
MKTRIEVIDGVYYPEKYDCWLWRRLIVSYSRSGDPVYYTGNLTEAKAAIDKYLKSCRKKVEVTSIIEYPLKD